MRELASISSICDVNPRLPTNLRSQAELPVSFVPMSAVRESGSLESVETRQLQDVLKGYTYFEEGDVLVAKITPCMENGKVAQAIGLPHPVGFGSTEFHVLRPGPDVDGRYLFHMIWNPHFRHAAVGSMTGSAGQRRVPTSFFTRFRIPLPSLLEQRRIAAILDKADAVRRKRQQTLDLADQFLRSAFLDMFGDTVTNPKGWPIRKLGTCAEIQGGLQVTTRRTDHPIEVPYLRVANVYRDKLDLAEVKMLRVTQEELERATLAKGDVLVVEGHGNPDEIGRSAVWDGSIQPCIHQNHLIRVRPVPNLLEAEYLSHFLNSSAGRRQMLHAGKTTSGLNTISTRNVAATAVLLPPLQQQTRFVETVRHLAICRSRLAMHGQAESELQRSLVHEAFGGEL